MANYTSNLIRRQQTQKPLNTEAIGFVLQSKENKWNANQAKIDEKLSQLGSIQLVRDQDKEHLVKNVEKLLGSIENAGKLDYSSDSVSRSLETALTGSIDDHLINQVGISRQIGKFQSGVQELSKKDPDSFSNINYQYAKDKAGLDAYMRGDTDEIGALEYSPYVNVNEELTKRLKDAVSIKGGKRVVQTRDIDGSLSGVPGTIIERSIEGLTQEEIASMLPTFMDGKMQKQLEIDGHFTFNGDDEIAQSTLKAYSDNVVESLDSDIQNIQTKLDSGSLDKATAEKYADSLNRLVSYRDQTSKQLESLSKSPADKIGGFLRQKEVVESLSNSLKGYENETYIKDNAYFANLSAEVSARAASKKAKEETEKDSAANLPDAISVPVASELLDSIDAYEEVQKEAQKINTEFNVTTNQLYNGLSQEKKASVDNLIKDPKYAGLSAVDARSKALRDSGVIDFESTGNLNRLEREYQNFLEDDQKIYEANLDKGFDKSETYNALVNNEGIKMVNEAGQKVSYKQYLESQGITSESKYKEFINDPVKSRTLKAKVTADYLLSTRTDSGFAVTTNNLGKTLQGREAGKLDESILMQFNRLTKVLGENKKFTDVFKVTKRNNELESSFGGSVSISTKDAGEADMDYIRDHKNDVKEKYRIELRPEAKGTETYKTIVQALQNGTFDGNNGIGDFGSDDSVQDDRSFRDVLSFESFQDDYREQVGQRGIRVKGFNQVYISPTTAEGNKKPIFESLRTAIASGEAIEGKEPLSALKNGVGISLARVPGSTNNFIISQGEKSIMVPQRVLERLPDINNRIELGEKQADLLIENGKPLEIKQGNLAFKPDSTKTYAYLEKKYGFNNSAYLAATPKGAKILLKQANKSLFPESGESTPWGETLNLAVDNYSKFSVKLQESGGTNYVEVYYDGEKISEVAQNVPKESLVNIVDYDPQIFATLALTNIATELSEDDNENFVKLYRKINVGK
ncbi:structural protein [Cellulophaga phage phi17:2_18]|uniref:Structural protein n=2 Tax=Lightbulbvirus Cba172 TaxID=1918525 RepID=S0A043_9CAUD|nr:virion structural protein [Cellulophaga phage phi17:2]AGO47573.1 structural protein [Cellulophaga phage phi17:2]ALO80443.1 structural protein [Cellulophaga phage phi17:2_18]